MFAERYLASASVKGVVWGVHFSETVCERLLPVESFMGMCSALARRAARYRERDPWDL